MLAGVAALAAVDLVFAFDPPISVLLLPIGLLLVGTGWLFLAVLGWRYLFAATALVALSYLVLSAAAPALRSAGWRMLVWTHQEELATAVSILAPVRMTDEARRVDARCTGIPGLRPAACATLRAAMRDVGAHGAWKEDEVTVFETYSSFNARGGLVHCTRGCKAPPPRPYPIFWKHVEGNWYRWAE